MRLLKLDIDGQFRLVEYADNENPPYAILSHMLESPSQEATFGDFCNGTANFKSGYSKIRFCGIQGAKDNINHFWLDNCCVNLDDKVELQKAMNSVIEWYRGAEKCYVYLSDVSTCTSTSGDEQGDAMPRRWKVDFRKSDWFFQDSLVLELVASKSVEFFSIEGEKLGDKKSLEQTVHEITGIPIEDLRGHTWDKMSKMENLALKHWNKAEWKEAEELFSQVLDMKTRILGPENPGTLTTMGNLASTHWSQGQWTEAEELETQVLQARWSILGHRHPDTMTSMGNLASIYWDQGRLEEAAALEKKVMDITSSKYGDRHPATITSMINFAFTLRDLGHPFRATSLLDWSVTMQEELFGPRHPDVTSSIHTLNTWRLESIEMLLESSEIDANREF